MQPEESPKVTYVTLPLPGRPVTVPLISVPASAFADLRDADEPVEDCGGDCGCVACATARALQDDLRAAEIDREVEAAYNRLHALAGDREREMTHALVLDVLRTRAADDMMLAWDLRAEESRIWELCGELAEIEMELDNRLAG